MDSARRVLTADVLIEDGEIKTERLRHELVTLPELEAAAHRQGFASLAEVERAILEPSGTICFVGKTPTVETTRHQELVRRLEQIGQDLAAVRGSLLARP